MSLVQRLKCWLKGGCDAPIEHVSPAIQQMKRNVEATATLKQQTRQIRETGIWPRDMIVGVYRPERHEAHPDD